MKQAGLLRPEDEAPPIRDQAHLVSLLATLAGGILIGPAGSEVRSSGDLVAFFDQLRTWYGDDPNRLATDRTHRQPHLRAGVLCSACPGVPSYEQYDLHLSQPTQYETFRVYSPWQSFEQRKNGLPTDFQINGPPPEDREGFHPLDLSTYLQNEQTGGQFASLTGPMTADTAGMLPSGQMLPYTVHFENPATASTSTAEIRVVMELDEQLDPRSFRLGDLQLGQIHVNMPQGRAPVSGRF